MKKNVKTVLCIDDDKDVLAFLKTVLKSGGFNFLEASNGREGLIKFNEKEPDFVIVDLMMEDVDAGLKLTQEIRRVDNKVPIYMLSSVGNNLYSSVNTSYFGLTGVFQKPLKPKILLETINSSLK
jgi:DNA-binding response OmpR family regulator